MNYFDVYSSYPDRTITVAWDSQVKEGDQRLWFADTLNERSGELFSRFAACYAELRALPRGARRSLQRRLARSSELAAILPEYLQQGGRRLQHRMAWSLAGAALLLALSQGIATAATITVTTNDPNIAADGQCSLIEAIINANNDAATHADCGAGNGADTIVLPANANITLSSAYTTPPSDAIGLPLIASPITIQGNDATIARQGNAPDFGLMAVTNSGNLTLQSVILSGGSSSFGGGITNSGTLTIRNSTIAGNTANFHGGGVRNEGFLSIGNSIISDNVTNYGGGVSNLGTLAIDNSTISGNTANGGGGVFNFGTLTIQNSIISGNTTNSDGGGVSNYGNLTIENSAIAGNTANQVGGGIYSIGSTTITNSTISGNTADVGGGLRNTAYCYFGCSSATLTIENSTISDNRANQGGGLSNALVCYASNCPSAILNLNRSLIAGNQASVAPEIDNQSANTVTANKFNLFGSNGIAGVSGFTPGPTDIVPGVSLAQILGPLQNNGGPTQTHALVPGSPAIDAGDPNGCRDSQGTLLITEQRGFARHADGNNDGTIRCDIGAFEFGAELLPIPLDVGATTLAMGEAGVSFVSDLMISGGVAPYVVSITKGRLPLGLSLGNDGVISGTPSPNAKSEKITVRITDSVNESVTHTFTITVLKALHIAGKLKAGRVGKDYTDSLKARGGLGPFNWNITSGAVPGLSFNNATGALAGVPTQAGEFPLTVQVTDALGGVDTETLTLRIR